MTLKGSPFHLEKKSQNPKTIVYGVCQSLSVTAVVLFTKESHQPTYHPLPSMDVTVLLSFLINSHRLRLQASAGIGASRKAILSDRTQVLVATHWERPFYF